MKTKKLLVLILLLGLSLNAFSQEEVVIKQVITNNLGDFTNISTIEINTDCPVMIKSGKEDAVYLVGDIDKSKSSDYKGFCVLKENVLSINSPYKGNKKDLTITIELTGSVYNYFLGENSKVAINNNLIYDNSGTFSIQKNSELSVDGIVKLENLKIVAKEDAKIRFRSINVEELNIDLDKRSVLILNGEINTINIKQAEGSHIAGDYKYKNIIGDSDDISDDLVNIINGEVKNPEDSSSLVLKELSDAFEEVSEDLKEEEPNEVIKPIADAFKTVADNLDKEDIKKEKSKEKKKESKASLTSQFGYGILGWSNRVSNIDNLFTSPKRQYTLAYSDSWSLGFRYEYKLNRRWTISTGLGYESNIFRFENNVKLNDFNGEKRIGFDTSSINAESKLVARYITLPLFVEFRIVKNFTVHVGAIAGVNFRTSSTGFKRDYDIPNAEVEERWGTQYDNFKPLKLDIQAGFGWGWTNFYVKYSLTPLFKDNKEIEAYPFSAGISFGI